MTSNYKEYIAQQHHISNLISIMALKDPRLSGNISGRPIEDDPIDPIDPNNTDPAYQLSHTLHDRLTTAYPTLKIYHSHYGHGIISTITAAETQYTINSSIIIHDTTHIVTIGLCPENLITVTHTNHPPNQARNAKIAIGPMYNITVITYHDPRSLHDTISWLDALLTNHTSQTIPLP